MTNMTVSDFMAILVIYVMLYTKQCSGCSNLVTGLFIESTKVINEEAQDNIRAEMIHSIIEQSSEMCYKLLITCQLIGLYVITL